LQDAVQLIHFLFGGKSVLCTLFFFAIAIDDEYANFSGFDGDGVAGAKPLRALVFRLE
jgi:hypothetical protein